jgi:hypothetical protein
MVDAGLPRKLHVLLERLGGGPVDRVAMVWKTFLIVREQMNVRLDYDALGPGGFEQRC